MSQKLPKKDYFTLKQVLHTMQALKYGVINLMITNQISGLLAASSTSLLP